MASIDKTYTDSYEEYVKFKNWADKQVATFYNGHKVCIGNWVWSYEKEDFLNGELPIMNTPTWMDIYLIQNCKSDFVLNRMKEVYGEDEYERFRTMNVAVLPSKEFQPNRKITIKRCSTTKFPLHNKPFDGKYWWLQCNDFDFVYDDDSKTWSNRDWYYPYNTNTSNTKSMKSLIRHLRKQYLPKGITFTVSGQYIGEEYLVKIA